MTDTRIVTLVSKDNEQFEITRRAIARSRTIEKLIQNLDFDKTKGPWDAIPITNVDANILKKVVAYCEHEVNEKIYTEKENVDTSMLTDYVIRFLNVGETELYELILAANFLNIKCLLHAACETVANMIKGKSTDEIRRIYSIESDFSEEEMERVTKDNAWCAL